MSLTQASPSERRTLAAKAGPYDLPSNAGLKARTTRTEVRSASYAQTLSAPRERGNSPFTTRVLLFSLLISVSAMLVSCSKKPEEAEPVVTVQTAVAKRGAIQQIVSAEAVLFPR